MTSQSVKLAPDARQRIDHYLDAIEQVLDRAGRPRGERRGITDEVEAQILEMLADRAGFQPTVDDVETVLAELDPPEAYAEGDGVAQPAEPPQPARPAPSRPPARPHLSRAAILGACLVPVALAALALLGLLLVPVVWHRQAVVWPSPDTAFGEGAPQSPMFQARSVRHVESAWVLFLAIPVGLVGLAAPLGTTILGLVAIGHIRRSKGQVYGMGLALLDALLFPLLLLDGVLISLGRAVGLRLILPVIVVLAVDAAIVVLCWYALRKRSAGSGDAEAAATNTSRQVLGIVSLALCVAGLLLLAVATLLGIGVVYYGFLAFEVAALVCGGLAWRATPLAKAGAIASGALMVLSLLLVP